MSPTLLGSLFQGSPSSHRRLFRVCCPQIYKLLWSSNATISISPRLSVLCPLNTRGASVLGRVVKKPSRAKKKKILNPALLENGRVCWRGRAEDPLQASVSKIYARNELHRDPFGLLLLRWICTARVSLHLSDGRQREGGPRSAAPGFTRHRWVIESRKKTDVPTLCTEGRRGPARSGQELKIEVSGPLLAAPKIPSTQTKS